MSLKERSLNKIFDNRVRLSLMSALVVNEALEFTALRRLLGLTDGNLAAHVSVLERNGYVRVAKEFVGRKPQTTYRVTDRGRRAFERHLDALERLIKESRRSGGQ